MIYFTSDLHFNHDRAFIYEPRGFSSVNEMNNTIIERWNSIVNMEDSIYVLGDIMLGNNEVAIKMLKQLKGNIHIIRGNHDTNARIDFYNNCFNVVEITEGKYLKIEGQNFYLCHYPTITSNLEKSGQLKEHLINLFGHTHQQTNFYNDIPFMYHVGVDSHDCYPVPFDQVIEDIKEKRDECYKYL